MKIYLYKSKTCSITAEKDYNDLWTIFQNTKKVFGNAYESIRLVDSLTRKQVLEIKASLSGKVSH